MDGGGVSEVMFCLRLGIPELNHSGLEMPSLITTGDILCHEIYARECILHSSFRNSRIYRT